MYFPTYGLLMISHIRAPLVRAVFIRSFIFASFGPLSAFPLLPQVGIIFLNRGF